MAENNQNNIESSSVPKFDGELNIESIISAPLIAASKANAIILQGQADFILNNCFDLDNNTQKYRPKMVEMSISQSIENIDSQSTETEELYFQMPLLCLLPLNAIAIENVKVDFDLEITSISSYKSSTNLFPERAVLNGRLAPGDSMSKKGKENTNMENRSATRLKVNIDVNKLPLSKGVLTLIDLYTKTIRPVSPKED